MIVFFPQDNLLNLFPCATYFAGHSSNSGLHLFQNSSQLSDLILDGFMVAILPAQENQLLHLVHHANFHAVQICIDLAQTTLIIIESFGNLIHLPVEIRYEIRGGTITLIIEQRRSG